MIINVIDMVDGAGQSQKSYLKLAGDKHFVELCSMSNGLVEMKNQILKIAATKSIKVLRILGHGGPGFQNVALGKQDPRQTGYGSSSIMASNLNSLIEIGPYFAPGARAELRGCGVANDQGKMIRALANLWQVRVQASTLDEQMGLFHWSKVVEARPGTTKLIPVNPIPVEKGI